MNENYIKIIKKALDDYPIDTVNTLLEDREFLEIITNEITKILKNAKKQDIAELSEKKIRKIVRKKAYWYLRRFDIEGAHIPLVERGEQLSKLIVFIEDIIKEEKIRILADFGCGLFPLTFPLWKHRPEIYVAIDNNMKYLKEIEEFANKNKYNIITIYGDLTLESPQKILEKKAIENVDLAIYSRVIGILKRTKKADITKIIEETPAKIIIVTEPRISLVKKEDITQREKKRLLFLAKKLSERGIIGSYRLVLLETDIVLQMYK